MVFRELVDLVLLAVNGGEFSSETAVQEADVEAYVPQAAHAVIRNAVFGLKAENRAERNATGVSGAVIDPGFFETYTLDVNYDSARQIHYADLPGKVQSWPGDAGMKQVFSKTNPDVTFTKVGGVSEYSSMSELANILDLYWHESLSDGSRIFLPGKDNSLCNIMATCAIEISSSLGDSRVPLPVGLEALVVQMATEHFRGQRSMPADVILDNKDVNAQTMAQT